MRECPRCDRTLTAFTVADVNVDGCNGCGGVWFDADELAQLAQAAKLDTVENWFHDLGTANRETGLLQRADHLPIRQAARQLAHRAVT